MKKKALILDLDNTIYPVSSIGDELFEELFSHILESKEFDGDFNLLKLDVMRRPFQLIAKDFFFSQKLKEECLSLLAQLTCDFLMQTFEDYKYAKSISCDKFLVTTGFSKLQWSKVHQLNIKDDFIEINIVDPSTSNLTKKDVFERLLIDYKFKTDEVLVVGDDLHSEIAAAKALGIDTVLYDYKKHYLPGDNGQMIIHDFKELIPYF